MRNKYIGLVWSSGTAQGCSAEGFEFEPCYGQRVLNLGKSPFLACSVDPSELGTCLEGYHNLGADRFAPIIGYWLQIAKLKAKWF